MKTTAKKSLWFTAIPTLCLVTITLFAAFGCDKTEIPPKHYTLNFVGEGVSIEPQSVAYGNYATAPENPEREGYDFGGWFTDNGTFINEWNFKTDIVIQNTTLYAKWKENTLQEDPIEIPFTEYSLAGTSCQWINLDYDDKLIVINSNEELENYISCSDGSYPDIDFSKHTLLLVSGTTPNGIVEISKRILQLSVNKYKLDIEVFLNTTEAEEQWITALIINKLSEESDIELVTTYNNNIIPVVIGQSSLYGEGAEGFAKQFSVIKTEQEWESLKTQLNLRNNVTNEFTEQNIDFSSFMVIFVIDEVKGNGGWTIDVTNITENSNEIVVSVSNLKTGNAASVITQPFQIVKIPITNKPIIFNDLTLSHNEKP